MPGRKCQATVVTGVSAVEVRYSRGEEGVCEAVFIDQFVTDDPENLCPNLSDVMLSSWLMSNNRAGSKRITHYVTVHWASKEVI